MEKKVKKETKSRTDRIYDAIREKGHTLFEKEPRSDMKTSSIKELAEEIAKL